MQNTVTLLNYDQIQTAVLRIAAQIDGDYENKDPLLLCVLRGGFMFFSDLVRKLTIDHQVDFLKVRSYGDRQVPETVEWVWPPPNVEGRHVIVVDDIIDTEATATFITTSLRMGKAVSVTYCTLLSKMGDKEYGIFCPYVGFDIGDHFVYGYGLDREGRDRHLLGIYYGC